MSTPKTIVLGAGMVGSAMAMDLARTSGLDVTVADANPDALQRAKSRYGLATIAADLSSPEAVRRLVGPFGLVLGALSSGIGLQTLRAVIETGKPYCDISFMPEDGWELDGLARQHGVCAVIDCGVAPGVSNLLVGHGAAQLDSCERVEILVGGLPVIRSWPFDYKAGYSPHDVIEEYTRPARVVEGGRIVLKEALSEPELMEFPGIGTLEAFHSDGLRSLAYTMKIPHMTERTLRYPGHVALMKAFRHTGLFSKEVIDVKGQRVRPLDVTAALLFPKWSFAEEEADVTVMRIVVEGQRGGRPVRLSWDLFDRYDPVLRLRSMSRTTGFAATSVATLMARGEFRAPGVHPPEVLGRDPELVRSFLAEYARRGVTLTAHTSDPTAPT